MLRSQVKIRRTLLMGVAITALSQVMAISAEASEHKDYLTKRQLSSAPEKVIRVAAADARVFDATSNQTPPTLAAEEIVVTGTRIVRDGYEAPTPLTVIGAEALENRADTSLVNLLATMPAATGSKTAVSDQNSLNSGASGVQSMNLRSLGTQRVLVLLDGQRVVSSTLNGLVDVSNFPSQLVERVDMVTGGASAVYGSDAVAGVINFILDKDFSGLKGEISGGITNYGDGKNYKAALTSGFSFAGGRGHVLLSGEHMHNDGVRGSDRGRPWNRTGHLLLVNPTYTPTNGQPQLLFVPHSALSSGTAGGIIISGPLKGTAFGEGGAPYTFDYGPIVSAPFMQGGDWRENDLRPYADVEQSQTHQIFFSRASYDITEGMTAFVQWNWAQNAVQNDLSPVWTPGSASGPSIRVDNAFLPASVRAAMIANNLTSFLLGTWNLDMPKAGATNERLTNRITAGVDGRFDAFDALWSWSAYYAYGATKITARNHNSPIRSRHVLAIDAVVNPATGQIVCRSVLQGANNGCRPWNTMGIGVNAGNEGALQWMMGEDGAFALSLITQDAFAASISGEPFSLWAGPISVALSAEYRKVDMRGRNDVESITAARYFGNIGSVTGAQSVREAAVETVVPLAQGWDLSAAARFTDYEFSGFVTTYKVGTTYSPIDDITFRATRSRDIRAPNIQELFATGNPSVSGSNLIDHFLGRPAAPTAAQINKGNLNLKPEKGDTTGIGVVLSPRFLEGFTMSVDFWDVKVTGAIQNIGPQGVVDSCFNGRDPSLCANIIRDSNREITIVFTGPANFAVQHARGIDLDATYNMQMDSLVPDWQGDFRVQGLMTVYLKDYRDAIFTPPVDRVGENNGGFPPNWIFNVSATYSLDPFSATLTGRGVSSGTLDNNYIECTSGCPVSIPTAQTINTNVVPGRFYMDANVNYKVTLGESAEANLFLSARNIFNTSKPPLQNQYYNPMGQPATLYDVLGTVYRVGVRFRM